MGDGGVGLREKGGVEGEVEAETIPTINKYRNSRYLNLK